MTSLMKINSTKIFSFFLNSFCFIYFVLFDMFRTFEFLFFLYKASSEAKAIETSSITFAHIHV